MKVSTLRTLIVLASCALGSSAIAIGQVRSGAEPAKITIPFGFTVGKMTFGAGEYMVRQVQPRVLEIQTRDTKSSMLANLHPADTAYTNPREMVLTFNKYGDRYFLSQVASQGNGWSLSTSSVEKE